MLLRDVEEFGQILACQLHKVFGFGVVALRRTVCRIGDSTVTQSDHMLMFASSPAFLRAQSHITVTWVAAFAATSVTLGDTRMTVPRCCTADAAASNTIITSATPAQKADRYANCGRCCSGVRVHTSLCTVGTSLSM